MTLVLGGNAIYALANDYMLVFGLISVIFNSIIARSCTADVWITIARSGSNQKEVTMTSPFIILLESIGFVQLDLSLSLQLLGVFA